MAGTPVSVDGAQMRGRSECRLFCVPLPACRRAADVRAFAALMCAVIGVQGTYLGYTVGVLTSIERRFELPASRLGALLAMYDVGHTLAVLLVGYCAAGGHKPRWTGAGVLLSAAAMGLLVAPHFIFGGDYHHGGGHSLDKHVEHTRCDVHRAEYPGNPGYQCHDHKKEEMGAYALLSVGQLVAGAAAAPFNTVAYVYIDDNVAPRQSPLYLGLLTAMYAFGPALGFALAALCNSIYVDIGHAPAGVTAASAEWVGCWWLGFVVCAALYLLLALPLAAFPRRLPANGDGAAMQCEMETLNCGDGQQTPLDDGDDQTCCQSIVAAVRAMPGATWSLLKNPVYTSMVLGWIFGSYLIGGYATYLPKYVETQYAQSASAADLLAGLISIGSVAVSTALGGYILTKLNWSVQRAVAALCCSWSLIVLTYAIAVAAGCPHEQLSGTHVAHNRWNFTQSCTAACRCANVVDYEPVCARGNTYFSPCHAGCKAYDTDEGAWSECTCALDDDLSAILGDIKLGRHSADVEQAFWHQLTAQAGVCGNDCPLLPLYIAIMFIGLFLGNLFFMTTMMTVLRCVRDEEKALSLSFASCATNILGFIPAPIIFGSIIDSSCVVWHSLCPHESGNCIVYDSSEFRLKYHLGNGAFQLAAVVCVLFCYCKCRTFKFPDECYSSDKQTHEDTPT